MNFLATLIILILSGFWYIISYKFLLKDIGPIISNNLSYTILLFLAGMYVFGILLGKTLVKRKNKKEETEYKEFLVYKNRKLSEELLENSNSKNYSEELYIAKQEKEDISKVYHNYEKDYEPTKNSIDIILDEKKEISKYNFNLKKEKINNKIQTKKENFILKDKDLKKEFKIKITNIDKKIDGEIEDTMFKNVAKNLIKQKKQDLKIIEGIGPKLEEILNKSGINSYKDLANSKISKLNIILQSAGKRYVMLHNPSTWAKQANYAMKGEFEELKNYQEKLVKGIEK